MQNQQRQIEEMSEFKELCETLKVGKLKFEAKIAELRQKKENIIQMKSQLKEKIKKEIDVALAKMLN